MEPLISVIVPIYRVEQYLDVCISSVISQTYKKIEIILVDDGSPDRCGMLCDEWQKKDLRIKVIHQKNGGLSNARNTALKIAKGEYIAFVDSDDVVSSTMLEKLLHTLQQENADIAECNYVMFTDKIPIHKTVANAEVSGYTTEDALSRFLEESTFKCVVWNKLYNRKIFDTVRFEEGKLHEDVFFTYQAFGLSKRIAKIEESHYYYRQRSGSIMQQKFSLRNLDALEGRRRQYFYIRDHFSKLSGKAQGQFLGNCLYMGQKALRFMDNDLKNQAMNRIQPLFREIYGLQTIEDSGKQKMWYNIARLNFQGCCWIRNKLKIGV